MTKQNKNQSSEIKKLVRENSHLFWFVPDPQKEKLSKDVVLETIFNYGDMPSVKNLIQIIGYQEARNIFYNLLQLSDRRKGNFHELTINFFDEYFRRNLHRHIQ